MARALFVTATDTGVGKTVTAVAALRGLAAAGVRAVGMKPVSAGVDAATGRNEDVDALAAASSVDAPPGLANPFAFAEPVAPHIAAARERRSIDIARIVDAFRGLEALADAIVVEGAGGVLVPLDERRDMLDIARELRLPAVLCVGIRLGCLSHARASELAIRSRGIRLAGWVACRLDASMPYADENVASLERMLAAPLVADFSSAAPPPMSTAALATLGLLEAARSSR